MVDVRETDAFARWLGRLRDEEARARVIDRIERLKQDNPGDVRPVGEGVSELRIPYGPGYRVYYVQRGTLATLLGGGTKRTQPGDIRKARDLARELNED